MAYITLSFDDCYKETIDLVLDMLGDKIKANFNIVTGMMGKKTPDGTFISWKDAKKILDKGHEISSHGYFHTFPRMTSKEKKKKILTNLTNTHSIFNYLKRKATVYKPYSDLGKKEYSVDKEIISSKKLIESKLKAECDSFVYPGGKYNSKVTKAVKQVYSSARGTTFGLNTKKTNKFLLKSHVWYNNTSLREANSWVKKAINKDAWLIECFHTIGKNKKEYEISKEIFKRHLKFILNSGIEIKTQSEVIGIWQNRS